MHGQLHIHVQGADMEDDTAAITPTELHDSSPATRGVFCNADGDGIIPCGPIDTLHMPGKDLITHAACQQPNVVCPMAEITTGKGTTQASQEKLRKPADVRSSALGKRTLDAAELLVWRACNRKLAVPAYCIFLSSSACHTWCLLPAESCTTSAFGSFYSLVGWM